MNGYCVLNRKEGKNMFNFDMIKILDLVLVVLLFFILAFIRSAITLKNKKRMDNREKAIQIIEQFENLLSEKNIKIPSEDSENNENEACIYGTEYYELEDSIIEILNDKNQKGDKNDY